MYFKAKSYKTPRNPNKEGKATFFLKKKEKTVVMTWAFYMLSH